MEEDIYYLEVELVTISYMPEKLKPGMKFLSKITVGIIEPEFNFFTLEEVPEDPDLFMSLHGAPVELALVEEETSNIYPFKGGFLYDDESESYTPINDKLLNDIINREDGFLWLHCDEDGRVIHKEKQLIISKIEYDGEDES